MDTVFIYFKADAADNSRVLEALRGHRDRLAGQSIDVRFSRRRQCVEGSTATWMETYSLPNPGAIADPGASIESSTAKLVRTIASSAAEVGLAGLAVSGRHLEIFDSVDP